LGNNRDTSAENRKRKRSMMIDEEAKKR